MLDRAALVEEFQEDARDTYAEKEQGLGLNPETSQPLLRDVERFVILQVVDTRWREHLENMDYLREGVHLRAMAQKDPLVEYTAEGHRMFEELNARDPRGGRAHALPRRDRGRGGRRSSSRRRPRRRSTTDGFAYAHESLAGAQAIAGGGWRRGAIALGGDGAR